MEAQHRPGQTIALLDHVSYQPPALVPRPVEKVSRQRQFWRGNRGGSAVYWASHSNGIDAMLTHSRRAPGTHWIARFMPLETLASAQALARRFREVDGIRSYVNDRARLVLPALLVMVSISIACAIGVVVFLADRHSLLALLGIVLLPVTLAGSLFVQAYVFFSWIEGRALARELAQRHQPAPGVASLWLYRKFGLDIRPYPPVPWVQTLVFLVIPLSLLAMTWVSFAMVVILLGIALPLAYAKLDS